MYASLNFVGNTSKKLPSNFPSNPDLLTANFCLQRFSLISRAAFLTFYFHGIPYTKSCSQSKIQLAGGHWAMSDKVFDM